MNTEIKTTSDDRDGSDSGDVFMFRLSVTMAVGFAIAAIVMVGFDAPYEGLAFAFGSGVQSVASVNAYSKLTD